MPIFERPPLDTLAPAKDRWTPIYLEHGRLEVDDSSIKWIGSDGLITRLPVATVSALILDPGTSITHAAVKAAAQCNCPLFWLGEDGLRFYAFGITPNHDNSMARIHATAWANKKSQNEIARRMFLHRFPEAAVHGVNIKQLRGMEGKRVKQTYADLSQKYGVTWKGRDYKADNWQLADGINRALSASNASLYALTAAVCCSMGYIPQLGFIHAAGTLPFIYDAADLYKHETSWPAAAISRRKSLTAALRPSSGKSPTCSTRWTASSSASAAPSWAPPSPAPGPPPAPSATSVPPPPRNPQRPHPDPARKKHSRCGPPRAGNSSQYRFCPTKPNPVVTSQDFFIFSFV